MKAVIRQPLREGQYFLAMNIPPITIMVPITFTDVNSSFIKK